MKRVEHKRLTVISLSLVLLFFFSWSPVFAQSLAADAHVSAAKWSEFDGHDAGIGGRLTWKPLPLIGVDADLTWYPSDFPSGAVPFSGSRIEGLFGVTVGPKIDRIRPFAKATAGFLNVADSPIAFACVAIFPPPLACVMAGGHTMPAYEIGGGVEIDASTRSFIRADVSDRILKYPGPTFDSNFERRDDGFFGGAIRFTLGAGIRF
jgi:hypothetical protein